MDEPDPTKETTSESSGDKTRFVALPADTRVVHENGRWIVRLNVPSWDPIGDAHPVTNNWKRISDHATQQEADVSASWIARSVNRQTHPPTGF